MSGHCEKHGQFTAWCLECGYAANRKAQSEKRERAGTPAVAVKRVVSGMPRQRLIEWWSILNARRKPSDMPKDCNPDQVFDALTRMISKRERLDFWSGDFECGLQMHKFR